MSDSQFKLSRPFTQIPPKGPPKVSTQARVLAQFRGGWGRCPTSFPDASGHTKSAASVIPRVLKDIRFEKRQDEAQILKVWNASIDPTVTAHAQPDGIQKGTLFIRVDTNAWHAEIVRWRRKEILTRLQAVFGMELIQRLSFRVG